MEQALQTYIDKLLDSPEYKEYALQKEKVNVLLYTLLTLGACEVCGVVGVLGYFALKRVPKR